jgi:hypothetical protein
MWSRLPRLLGQDDNLYSRFWSQAVRWLAGRPMEDERPLLAVRTGEPSYPAKSKVTVTVLKQRRLGAETAGAALEVTITDPKGEAIKGLVGKASLEKPEETAFEFVPGRTGRYRVSALLKAEGKVLANTSGEVLVRGGDLELESAATRPDNLKAISDRTGGVSVDVTRAEEAGKAVQPLDRPTVRTQRTELWNSWWLFGAFVVAVSVEWLLRRRNHLV